MLYHADESSGSSNLLPLVSVGSDASEGGGFHYFRLDVGSLAFLPLGLAGVLDLSAGEDPRLCLFIEEAAADTLALVSAVRYIWYVSAEKDPRQSGQTRACWISARD
jgi:hypothetical protein